ncbi:MAG: hypothetical protein R3C49_21805 [Planctomycetaceae bacterium]
MRTFGDLNAGSSAASAWETVNNKAMLMTMAECGGMVLLSDEESLVSEDN